MKKKKKENFSKRSHGGGKRLLLWGSKEEIFNKGSKESGNSKWNSKEGKWWKEGEENPGDRSNILPVLVRIFISSIVLLNIFVRQVWMHWLGDDQAVLRSPHVVLLHGWPRLLPLPSLYLQLQWKSLVFLLSSGEEIPGPFLTRARSAEKVSHDIGSRLGAGAEDQPDPAEPDHCLCGASKVSHTTCLHSGLSSGFSSLWSGLLHYLQMGG